MSAASVGGIELRRTVGTKPDTPDVWPISKPYSRATVTTQHGWQSFQASTCVSTLTRARARTAAAVRPEQESYLLSVRWSIRRRHRIHLKSVGCHVVVAQDALEKRLFTAQRGMRTAKWPAVCPGQRRLEAHLLDHLVESCDDDPDREGIYDIFAATAGTSCLHLRVSDVQLGYLVAVLSPDLWGVEGEFGGVPGLRLVEKTDRLLLRASDGHGQIFFHLGPKGHRPWKEWYGDDEYELCPAPGCSPARCPRAPMASDNVPLLHMLRSSPILHPRELAALRAPGDTARDAILSHELRQTLAILPACDQAHSAPTSRSRPRRLVLGNGSLVLTPDFFHPEPQLPQHVSDVSEALSRQLLEGLREGAIVPGNLLLDIKGITARISGSRTIAARWAQAAFHQVASRTGLLRYRLRQADDPGPPVHHRTRVWEVNTTAPSLMPSAALELPPMDSGPA